MEIEFIPCYVRTWQCGKLKEKIDAVNELMKDCEEKLPIISGYAPRFNEEQVLVGKYGSGTINFADFDQGGKEIAVMALADAMLELQNKGCLNISLVTPTRQVPQILEALFFAAEKGLKVPLVYNTSSYDFLEVIKLLHEVHCQ